MDYQNEDQQVEALKKWWDENGTALVIGATLGIGAILGWQFWKDSVKNKQLAASDIYQKVLEASASEDGKVKPIEGAGEIFADYADTPYAALISFRLAKESVDKDDLAGAEENLRKALNFSSDKNLQHIARTRLARVLVAQNKADDALQLISNVDYGSYKARYEYIKGNIYTLKGDLQKAAIAYKEASANKSETAPENPNLKYRIEASSQSTVDVKDAEA